MELVADSGREGSLPSSERTLDRSSVPLFCDPRARL